MEWGQLLAQGRSLLAMVPTGLVELHHGKLGNVKKDIFRR
jgi:hypothetical protein